MSIERERRIYFRLKMCKLLFIAKERSRPKLGSSIEIRSRIYKASNISLKMKDPTDLELGSSFK